MDIYLLMDTFIAGSVWEPKQSSKTLLFPRYSSIHKDTATLEYSEDIYPVNTVEHENLANTNVHEYTGDPEIHSFTLQTFLYCTF